MSAFLDSSSQIIGDYMLRGWTMTDRTCVNCRITPLMRQPAREVEREAQRIEFCATCQGGPDRPVRTPQPNPVVQTEEPAIDRANDINGTNGINGHSRTISDSTSFDDDEFDIKPLEHDRAMDMSFELPTPNGRIPAPAPAPAVDSAMPTARNPAFSERDAQSARASSLIGDMLLRGFSLLADSCPNSTCYGIPLVGHPRARRTGGRDAGLEDMKRECVICHRIYDKDGALLQGGSSERVEQPARTVVSEAPRGTTSSESKAPDSPRTVARRALYAEGQKIQAEAKRAQSPEADAPRLAQTLSTDAAGQFKKSPISLANPSKAQETVSETVNVLVATLSKLNSELSTMLQHPDVKRTIKDKSMKRCLDRIRDTMEALGVAEELRAKLSK